MGYVGRFLDKKINLNMVLRIDNKLKLVIELFNMRGFSILNNFRLYRLLVVYRVGVFLVKGVGRLDLTDWVDGKEKEKRAWTGIINEVEGRMKEKYSKFIMGLSTRGLEVILCIIF